MASIYQINAQPDLEAGGYRLYNHTFPAGGRLIKHAGFPFTGEDWTRYPDKAEAEEAAKKLQHYLDHPKK